MIDYKQTPELIRSFLAATDAAGQRGWNDETADLATSYSAFCAEANERLRRCAEYLHRGMRSEAVHLAECQPRLIELAESLRLPDPIRWARVCMTHDLPPPPELLTAGLDELQAAFPIEISLEPLLARHRLLALAQAPVRHRLEVARALLAADAENPSWDEDVRLLESARFGEMRAEAKVAFAARNLAALEKLSAELAQHPPRAPLPDDLRDGLARALNAVRLEQARKKLLPLLTELEAARNARNAELVGELLGRWEQTVEAAKVTLPADLLQKIRPVLSWLAAESQRRESAQRLEAIQPIIAEGNRNVKSWNRRQLTLAGLAAAGAALFVGILIFTYFKVMTH